MIKILSSTNNKKADGQLFLLDGGYLEFFNKKRKSKIFEKANKIGIIINTILILFISSCVFWINNKSNQKIIIIQIQPYGAAFNFIVLTSSVR